MLKLAFHKTFFLPFLYKTQKMLVFCETCYLHIEYRDVHAKKI
jgi:hypothetical protein